MHFSDLGAIAQLLAFIFAVYALLASLLGGIRQQSALLASGRRAVLMVAGFLLIAAIALIVSFLQRDFGLRYVAEHSSTAMPWYYTLAAFYGGQEGSLLYWTTMLAIFSSVAVLLHRRAPAGLMPYVVAVLMTIDGFFLFVLNFVTTPFGRLRIAPTDGQGLNPILQDPGMLVHPPMLLMGYMSWSIPFAFAMAAMISGRLDGAWLRAIRRWTLVAWSIQTTGLLLGAWWAYHVLGWGGYWGWDPVENAALLPWLTATAFLHSIMVQERRGSLKVWNLGLILATFGLSLFGTFEVRSGIITSVHSFAYSAIGPYFLGFLAFAVLGSLAIFIYRLPRLHPEHEFDSFVSREGSFLLNNFLLTGIAFVVFWGTIFPIISETVRGQTMTVGTAFYQQATGPLFLLLIFTMGIGPLLAWRRASLTSIWRNCRWPALAAALCAIILPVLGVTNILANIGFAVCAFAAGTIIYELWRGVRVRHAHGEAYHRALVTLISRHRQRYGGYLVHLGLITLAIGVIGSQFFQAKNEFILHKGDTAHINGYAITYQGISGHMDGDVQVIQTRFGVSYNGQHMQDIAPGERIFPGFESQPTSIVSITTHNLSDLYVFLSGYEGTDLASIKVFINPLVPLVWLGGLLMLFGGIVCWWPPRPLAKRITERTPPTSAKPVEVMA
ncbi:MAG: Cytochrome c heme lyase subunit CcmF [Ktedonobacterales bacterium]|nr:MAG: Cytochrome c heme lyase subunit CcmF [Ktedonobacterales bacterium]